jgi:methylated-DNA-[protein]-cysteine S-methyltransferase
MAHAYKIIATPVGALKLVASDNGLAAILWENDDPKRVRLGALNEDPAHPVLVQTERELAEYFAGTRTVFTVPLDVAGTAFQKKVWDVLRLIPFGETRSYGGIAAQIGSPKASRAVGAANGRNPVSIIVPCHRAIGSNGALTGFAGGIETKSQLLALEGRQGTLAA